MPFLDLNRTAFNNFTNKKLVVPLTENVLSSLDKFLAKDFSFISYHFRKIFYDVIVLAVSATKTGGRVLRCL